MAKPNKKKAPAKNKTAAKKYNSVVKQAPAKQPATAKQAAPVKKATGRSGATPALTKGNIHVELGNQLTATRGDEAQERAAIASAIHAFMQLAIAGGLPANTSAYVANCPEFFWEGDGVNPPVYARVPDATHDEIGRWFKFIVEGVRAYDARNHATA